MPSRYLFGPVPAAFAEQKLYEQRQAGSCLTFNATGDADLLVSSSDGWEAVCARLPVGWQADFVVLNLGYTCIPDCLWSVEIPLVGLAQDWTLLWHYYRRRLRQCELVLTDTLGVETLLREGIARARSANLFGCDRSFVEEPWPKVERDIDVLFVGNFNPAVQRERMPWLGRLARLTPRRNVILATGVYDGDYRRLLVRSRIVFNHSIRGECNLRVFEAAAAGSLLFQEEGNREVPAYFAAGQQCIYYNAHNLEWLLEHYLDHEEERRTIAESARSEVRRYTFAKLWEQQLQFLEAELPALQERVKPRKVCSTSEALRTRTWQRLCSNFGDDPALARDLQTAPEGEPRAALHRELGLLMGLSGGAGTESSPARVTESALAHFLAAQADDPADLMAGLNAAEALGDLGRLEAAIAQARKTLHTLEQAKELSPTHRDAAYFSPRFDVFRVEWERAAWTHAGRPAGEDAAKRALLRWRLHSLLATWTGELEHYRQAQQARPDLWPTLAALGCALGQSGQTAAAIEYLRAAVAANPLDAAAARALYHALSQAGDHTAQQALRQDRKCLATAFPQLAPEPWLQSAPPSAPVAVADTSADWLEILTPEAFAARFGSEDIRRALCGYTNSQDTQVVLTLLAHARPRRLLEVGTALGHMTANLTEWSPDEALIFSLGTTAELPAATVMPQRYETPDRQSFGCQANAFGKVGKVCFITADSLTYDFRRLEWLDFAFIDGAHDMRHVLSDTLNVYEILRPGGYLIWHDFTSPVEWVEVRRCLEKLRFPEKISHVAGTAVAFLRKGEPSAKRELPSHATTEPKTLSRESVSKDDNDPLFIVWEGTQQAVHSFAGVNRALCTRLLARGHVVSVLASDRPGLAEAAPNGASPPAGCLVVDGRGIPLPPPLAKSFYRKFDRPAEFHVRHQWPPQFTPPPEGHWILIQPWEYGSLPKAWVEPLTQYVDEVWAYSQYVRDCYLAAGVPADRVHVVACGVDCERFQPQAPPLSLPTNKRFKFLFVGGTIHRKGIDLLLEAYARSFHSTDDVCLVIKDMGVGSFYKGQTAEQQIARFQEQSDAPEILYLRQELSEAELARLYTACDCLVHPYRGEGFGLPIAEAMACGLPVIVTGLGPALDFCSADTAYLIPARQAFFPEKRVGEWETVDYPWMAEPDLAVLADQLRHVFEHLEEARNKGRCGCERIRRHFTWEHAAQAAERRMLALRRKPIRRFLPATPLRSVLESLPTVALCMIVKNEEDNLPACLESVADLVDEIIVVDTGSTDRTREIAAQMGARVFDFPWVDSFAAARNESLRHATGDWVFWLDADDRLDGENRQRLRTLFAGLPNSNVAFVMKCLCLPDQESRTATVVDHVRLFRNDPSLRWEYRVHEQILPALRRCHAEVRWSDVVIHHSGYQEPALRQRKLERDRRLLQMESAEKPDDPFILFNLGSIAQEQGQLPEAVSFLRRSLERSHPHDSIVRKLYALLSQCHRRLGQLQAALALCLQGREIYPDDVELLFQEGLVRREQGDHAGAKACWLQLLQPRQSEHFASLDTGLCGYKARHNLASLYLEEHDLAAAEEHWRLALTEAPGFAPARLGLGEVYLLQGRWTDLEQIAAELARQGLTVDAEVLRARGHMVRREFRQACRLLEEAICRSPEAPQLRRVLSYAFLQEGADWQAAERALRDVLALDPQNAEARHNLAMLLLQQGQEVAATEAEHLNHPRRSVGERCLGEAAVIAG